jgi:hypothetical protein
VSSVCVALGLESTCFIQLTKLPRIDDQQKAPEDAFSPMVQEINTNKKRKAWPGRWDLTDATPVDYRQKGQRSDGTSFTKAEKLPRSRCCQHDPAVLL